MSYIERLQALWSDPATHNMALALAVLWLRIEQLHKRHGRRLHRLERVVFPLDSHPPALELATNRRNTR